MNVNHRTYTLPHKMDLAIQRNSQYIGQWNDDEWIVLQYRSVIKKCLESQIPYNPYLAHRALSKLEFPNGNIYCIIPKERTPSRFNYLPRISISYEVGRKQNALLFIVIGKQNRIQVDTKILSKQQDFSCSFIKKIKK